MSSPSIRLYDWMRLGAAERRELLRRPAQRDQDETAAKFVPLRFDAPSTAMRPGWVSLSPDPLIRALSSLDLMIS